MRAVELAKVAAAAEALRLRRMVRRQGTRAVYGAAAAVFAIAVFVLLHVIAYNLLAAHNNPALAALYVLLFDLVVAGALGFMALRNTADAVEAEALRVRKQAILEMRKSVAVMAVAGEVGGLLMRRRARNATTLGGKAWLLGDLARRFLARR